MSSANHTKQGMSSAARETMNDLPPESGNLEEKEVQKPSAAYGKGVDEYTLPGVGGIEAANPAAPPRRWLELLNLVRINNWKSGKTNCPGASSARDGTDIEMGDSSSAPDGTVTEMVGLTDAGTLPSGVLERFKGLLTRFSNFARAIISSIKTCCGANSQLSGSSNPPPMTVTKSLLKLNNLFLGVSGAAVYVSSSTVPKVVNVGAFTATLIAAFLSNKWRKAAQIFSMFGAMACAFGVLAALAIELPEKYRWYIAGALFTPLAVVIMLGIPKPELL